MTVPIALRRWLRLLTRGSPLYLLSAACILYGISEIIVPLYAGPDLPKTEKFYCLGAINLYEIALLTVALIVISYRHATDDAISLVALIGTFLVASAAALNTVAPAAPMLAIGIGLLGIGLAVGKLWLLGRCVIRQLSNWPLAAISVLLLWNFLAPGVLGRCLANDVIGSDLVQVWAGGWWLCLIAGTVLVVGAMRLPAGRLTQRDPSTPLLRSELMRWLFASLLLTVSFLHAYAQPWAFFLPIRSWDLLPATGVLAMLAIALRHGLGWTKNDYDLGIALVPLFLAAIVLGSGTYTFDDSAGLGLISYPPAFAAVMSVALAAAAWRLRRHGLLPVAAVSLVFAAAAFGVKPGASPAIASLNWPAATASLGVTMVVLAAVLRNQYWALGATTVIALGATFADASREWIEQHDLALFAALLLVLGLLVQVVHCLFRSRQTRVVAIAGTMMLAAGAIHCFVREDAGLHYPFTAGIGVLALGVLLIGTARDWLTSIPTVIPLGGAVSQATPGSGWDWVILSFMLLAAGAVVSIWKERLAAAFGVGPQPDICDMTRLAEVEAEHESDGATPDGLPGLAEDSKHPPD